MKASPVAARTVAKRWVGMVRYSGYAALSLVKRQSTQSPARRDQACMVQPSTPMAA